MSDAVLERYVRDLIAAEVEAGERRVTFAWQGGEPTMLGVDFFEKAVALQKQYCPEGVRIENAFQTNGMLLDDDWGSFLAREDFLVGISIDGPRADPRPLPARSRRAPDLRQGDAGARRAPPAPGGVQYPHHRPSRERDSWQGGLPLPARSRHGAHPVHPHRRAARRRWQPRRGAAGRRRPGQCGQRMERLAARLRQVPVRRVRHLVPQGRRPRLHPVLREPGRAMDGASGLVVRLCRDLRGGARAGTQWRPLCLRPLCLSRVPAGQHRRDAAGGACLVGGSGDVRQEQARHADRAVPGLRIPLRLQWRLPQAPLPALARTASRGTTISANPTRASFAMPATGCG